MPGGGQRPSTYLPLPPTAREDLRLGGYLEYSQGTIHLETSISSSGFEHWPYGTAVNVANHYTGWVTQWIFFGTKARARDSPAIHEFVTMTNKISWPRVY
ncbi:hypothetical protein TNCV_3659121 [Trichonephila clavipes]|nr:hypothetical protein TNCV_3659121 [Trichonephila clavipes]